MPASSNDQRSLRDPKPAPLRIARQHRGNERTLGMNKGRLTSLVRLSYLGPEIVRALLAGQRADAEPAAAAESGPAA
jgi:hypothetical protein